MEHKNQKQEHNESSVSSTKEVHLQPSGVEREEACNPRPQTDLPEKSQVSGDEEKVKATENVNNDCFVIDVKENRESMGGDPSWKGEKICRICHMSSDYLSVNEELIELGCGCKDELGVAHRRCASLWFGLKGNRQCEICGRIAENIIEIAHPRINVDLNETTLMNTTPTSRPEGSLCDQHLYNLLFVFLVLGFMLGWFFEAKSYSKTL